MVARYQASPSADTLVRIVSDLVQETQTLIEQRQAKSNLALLAIFRELDDKYKAFARKCPDVNPNGFKIGLQAVIPLVKEIWP